MDDGPAFPSANPDIERREAALKALQDTARTLSTAASSEELLHSILDVAIDVLDATGASLFMWNEETGLLHLKATTADSGPHPTGRADAVIAEWVFTHRQPLNTSDTRRDPELRAEIAGEIDCGDRALIAAPLVTPQQVLGVIQITDKRSGEAFDDLDLDILTALAGQVSVAIENACLADRLRQQRERLLAIEREVHRRVARELHDGPAQWLAGISMSLEYISRLLEVDVEKAKVELKTVHHTLDKTVKQLRNLMFELRPIHLEEGDLQAALEHYVGSLRQTEGMNIQLQVVGGMPKFDLETDRIIFDIVREAVSNIKRHAHTKEVWIEAVHNEDGVFSISIRDKGIGFDVDAVQKNYYTRGSFGLLNMIERAESIGGRLTLKSMSGYGTTVRLEVPTRN